MKIFETQAEVLTLKKTQNYVRSAFKALNLCKIYLKFKK